MYTHIDVDTTVMWIWIRMWMRIWMCGCGGDGDGGRRVCVTSRWVQRGCCHGDRRPASEAAIGATSQRQDRTYWSTPLASTPTGHQPSQPIVHLGCCIGVIWGRARKGGKNFSIYTRALNGISFDNAHGRSCFSVANCCLNKFRLLFSLFFLSFHIDRIPLLERLVVRFRVEILSIHIWVWTRLKFTNDLDLYKYLSKFKLHLVWTLLAFLTLPSLFYV